MNSLLTVIKGMLELLGSQQEQISALQVNANMDDAKELTDVDFVELTAQIMRLSANTDDETIPF